MGAVFIVVAVVTVHWTMTHCNDPRLLGSVLRLVSLLPATLLMTPHSY